MVILGFVWKSSAYHMLWYFPSAREILREVIRLRIALTCFFDRFSCSSFRLSSLRFKFPQGHRKAYDHLWVISECCSCGFPYESNDGTRFVGVYTTLYFLYSFTATELQRIALILFATINRDQILRRSYDDFSQYLRTSCLKVAQQENFLTHWEVNTLPLGE